MPYKNEDEIKQALGIDSWKNLSKDKMVRFAAMMPDMDTEVALKIVEQFPVFKDFANDVVDSMKKEHESTLSANKTSQDHFYRVLQENTEILKTELSKSDLSWEERKFIIEKLQETATLAFKENSENKRFLDGIFKKALVSSCIALAAALVFVGGKVMAGSEDGSGDSPEA